MLVSYILQIIIWTSSSLSQINVWIGKLIFFSCTTKNLSENVGELNSPNYHLDLFISFFEKCLDQKIDQNLKDS